MEEFRKKPSPPAFPLPNFPAGPGLPLPVSVNFYEQHERYPDYLCCTYNVQENHYDESNEPAWFASALLQIRGTGRERFPPIRWIAVMIANRAEHKDATTFEQSRKVGAIFNAADVFDPAKDPQQLIAHAALDRHPFFYDTTQPTPGEQQCWMIVERHAPRSSGRSRKISRQVTRGRGDTRLETGMSLA